MHFPTVKSLSNQCSSLFLVSAHGDTGLVKEAFIEEYHRRIRILGKNHLTDYQVARLPFW